jgi:hypothetical protein
VIGPGVIGAGATPVGDALSSVAAAVAVGGAPWWPHAVLHAAIAYNRLRTRLRRSAMIRTLQPAGLCLCLCLYPYRLHLVMLWMQVSCCQQHAGIGAGADIWSHASCDAAHGRPLTMLIDF